LPVTPLTAGVLQGALLHEAEAAEGQNKDDAGGEEEEAEGLPKCTSIGPLDRRRHVAHRAFPGPARTAKHEGAEDRDDQGP
jgi:hypothetical protein